KSPQPKSAPKPKEDKQPQKEENAKPQVVEKQENSEEEPAVIKTQYQKLSGTTFTGQTIDLSQFNKPKKKKETNSASDSADKKRNKKRKRIVKDTPADKNATGSNNNKRNNNNKGKDARPKKAAPKVEPTEEEGKNQIKETLERLQGKQNKSTAAKYRKDKRELHRKKEGEARAEEDNRVL